MLKRSLLILILIFFSVVLVSADGVDDQGNPNDPNVNERANACFEGGDMAGKCDTEWEWMCGWYIIRLTEPQDEVLRAAFPPDCLSLLPALEIITIDEVRNCIDGGFGYSLSLPIDTIGPMIGNIYTGTTCSGAFEVSASYVIAVDLSAAQALCPSPQVTGWPHTPPLWVCQ